MKLRISNWVTQLFGDRMLIANATGCSSIWGASAPSMPYCKDENGRGPAWANSLFEDNAEYGYGMLLAAKQMREKIEHNMKALMELDIDEKLKEAIEEWLEYKDDGRESRAKSDKVIYAIENMSTTDEVVNMLCERIMELKDFLVKKSVWALGGDGWAYDIGYGGLDHVLLPERISISWFRYRKYTQYRRTGIQGHAGSCYCEVHSRR